MTLGHPTKILFATLGTALLVVAAERAISQEPASEFASGTIDLGMLVSDLDKSVAFYTEQVGFTEVEGFSVDAEFCSAAGLTDARDLAVRVLVLKEGTTSTRLKLMSLPDAKPREADGEFVHSRLGFRYLTIRTTSLAPSLGRLKAAGAEPLARGPVPLPGVGADGPHLAVVRDPDGNLVELIGTL